MAGNIKPKFRLEKLFKKQTCFTIEELHQHLNYSIISIRRFLKDIGYYSSFTHNSKWYTLHNIPSFDKNGIWFYKDIGFSKHGNLSLTILHFINKSTKGLSAKELFKILAVQCHPVLNQMYKRKKIDRVNSQQGFIYLSPNEKKKQRQLKYFNSLIPPTKIKRLIPQAAIYILVEFIKNPKASFLKLSSAVEKKGVKASPEAIAQLFKDHDLKKNPRQ